MSPLQQRMLRLITIYEKQPWIAAETLGVVRQRAFYRGDGAFLPLTPQELRREVQTDTLRLGGPDVPEAMWLAQGIKKLRTQPPKPDPKLLARVLVQDQHHREFASDAERRDFLWAHTIFVPTMETLRGEWQSVLDWMRATHPDVQTLTIPQAIDRTKRWHQKLARDAKRAKPVQRLAEGDWGPRVDLPGGWFAHQLLSTRALDKESQELGHCVGTGGYDHLVGRADNQFWSIRNPQGAAVLTVHVVADVPAGHAPGRWFIRQAKGANNRPVGITWEQVRAFGPERPEVLGAIREGALKPRTDELAAYAAWTQHVGVLFSSYVNVSDDFLHWTLIH